MGKRWIFAPLLAAAIAGPAAFIDDEDKSDQPGQTANPIASVQSWLTGGSGSSADSTPTALSQSTEGGPAGVNTALSADGVLYQDEAAMLDRNSILYAPGAVDLRQAFRFDANPQWLQQNWPRVSSIQSLDGLAGYRVPFVSGPNQNDITGALSFYFDRKGECERITFYGYSSDPTRIAQLATGHFRMSADEAVGPGTYTGRYARRIRNLLLLQTEQQSDASQRYQITMEINNPQGRYQLSPEASRIVQPAGSMLKASFRR